ncbi:hypothetical protein BV898_16805 [Hypsibius exemplaris]|uniref:Uncharacterized protein n=1 Tax=Hypsibius exemplaris TaxID=2072580 RepID=A0A9X6NDW6_HYPEX|nr:hypothetical protein BV898_16805 [Hypsibius exemplaris]
MDFSGGNNFGLQGTELRLIILTWLNMGSATWDMGHGTWDMGHGTWELYLKPFESTTSHYNGPRVLHWAYCTTPASPRHTYTGLKVLHWIHRVTLATLCHSCRVVPNRFLYYKGHLAPHRSSGATPATPPYTDAT